MRTPDVLHGSLSTDYRRRDRAIAEFRAMTDRQRAEWVQHHVPDKFIDCPACADRDDDPHCRCLGTRKLSKAGARAWFAERGLDAREQVPA